MFKYKNIETLLIEEREKNKQLKAKIDKNSSDIDYIAMMTDVNLETETVGASDE